MKTYQLTLNEEQLRVLKDVCELRFRIDLLQYDELAEILALIDTDLDKKNPDYCMIFDRYIDRKDHIKAVLGAVFEIASPHWMRLGHKRNSDSLICEDLWQVIRYQFYREEINNSDRITVGVMMKPRQISKQQLPQIVVKGESK